MKEARVGSLVVIDEEDRPIGLVTDRDIALWVLTREVDPNECAIETFMSHPVHTITTNDELLSAARAMRRYVVRRMPIVDENGRLVGILTADDVARELACDLEIVVRAEQRGIENEARPVQSTESIFGRE